MKFLLLVAFLTLFPGWQLLTKVRNRNAAVARGSAAYQAGQAQEAAYALARAVAADQRHASPELLLDLGHAQLRAGQQAKARATYGQLLTGSPPAIGSVARQQLAVLAARTGQPAQALALLRQALLLDPANEQARYNYELLSEYLTQQPDQPAIPSPGPTPQPAKKPAEKPDARQPQAPAESQPADRPGTDRAGQASQPRPGSSPPVPRPGAGGGESPGRQQPGAGPAQPLPVGQSSGSQRGLDPRGLAGTEAAAGRSARPGTEAADPADLRLQTQRERLRAMNLTPAQARQLLDALGAQEQQYLQQLTRPSPGQPDPSRPTW